MGTEIEMMDEQEARVATVIIFGEDSFTETDGDGRYYVGKLPTSQGAYQGFMGFSWDEALEFARASQAAGD